MGNKLSALRNPLLLCAIATSPWHAALAAGGIATDGTMGAAQNFSGANIGIPQRLGATVGTNLFHSFAEFNITSGQTVEFTGSDALRNVISRVTGSSASHIDGLLKSSIAHAAFYFINPNGITFGAHGEIDVPGAFHVGTADKVDFPDGGAFYADDNRISVLRSAPPAAFGFLTSSTDNNGLIAANRAQLSVREHQILDMVAGDITLNNGAGLYAPSGQIRLVAIKGASQVELRPALEELPLPDAPAAEQSGRIAIADSKLHATGNGGGRIALWGTTTLANSEAWADNTGASDATPATGVAISGRSLTVDNSTVSFDALAAGDAGNLTVKTTGALNIVNGGFIKSSARAGGDAGDVTVAADAVTIDKQERQDQITGLFSEASFSSSGDTGNVTVNARAVNIVNGGVIKSSTQGVGNAGRIAVTATDALTIDSRNNSVLSGIYSINQGDNSGDSGDVAVTAGTLTLVNGGQISSSTLGAGDAGQVNVTANALMIDSRDFSLWPTGIVSQAEPDSTGDAGNLTIRTESLAVINGGQISSSTFAPGDAGNVDVSAARVHLDSLGFSSWGTGIFSQANRDSTGNAGHVVVNAGTLAIDNGGVVSSSTFSEGAAGSVKVAADTLSIDGLGPLKDTGIFSKSISDVYHSSSGRVGNVTVNAATAIRLSNHGAISIENSGAPANPATINPGAITIASPTVDMTNSTVAASSTGGVAAGKIVMAIARRLTMDRSFITTTAILGNGGAIRIDSDGLMVLRDSGFTTTTSDNKNITDNNGGNIAVAARLLVMDSGLIQANAIAGRGGNITLSVNALVPNGNTLALGGAAINWQPDITGLNVIQAAPTAPGGVSGTLNVTPPQLNLSGIVANLGNPQFKAPMISQDFCELVSGSSLTRKGAGGLRPKSGKSLPF